MDIKYNDTNHSYSLGDLILPSVTEVIKGGKTDFIGAKMIQGSESHDCIITILNQNSTNEQKKLATDRLSSDNFKIVNKIKELGLDIEMAEVVNFAEFEGVKVAGTADIIAIAGGGKKAVIDIKTKQTHNTSAGVSKDYKLQIVAYMYMNNCSIGCIVHPDYIYQIHVSTAEYQELLAIFNQKALDYTTAINLQLTNLIQNHAKIKERVNSLKEEEESSKHAIEIAMRKSGRHRATVDNITVSYVHSSQSIKKEIKSEFIDFLHQKYTEDKLYNYTVVNKAPFFRISFKNKNESEVVC